jgi:hypothetical protein
MRRIRQGRLTSRVWIDDARQVRREAGSARLDELHGASARVIATALTGEGRTPPEARRAAFEGRPDNDVIDAYLEKVRRHADRVLDDDIDGLRAAGLDDDAIFELTFAAALGAGTERLEAGLALLQQGAADAPP